MHSKSAARWRQVGAGYVALFFALTALLCGVLAASAAVVIARFEATAQGNTIAVVWETATELQTSGFELYRAQSDAPADWGAAIYETRALGDSLVGATYTYTDTAPTTIASGVRYYYRLVEVTSDGKRVPHSRLASAGIDVPPELTRTPTATMSATATTTTQPSRTATATTVAQASRTATATAAQGTAPTATRQFANTSQPDPTATRTPAGFATPTRSASATPAGPAVVASPTAGPTSAATLFASATPATPTGAAAPVTPLSPANATSAPPLVTPSPEPGRTSTPQVFEPVNTGQPELGARPTSQPKQPLSRTPSTALLLGGGAIALALALGVGAFFLWRARQR